MNDVESSSIKLSELLRYPDDLDKIAGLKAEFTRKKAAVDSQLKQGLKEQLEITQSGMDSISDGQKTVNAIREEMMKIDKLCAESQTMIMDFPQINLVAQTHRNFEQVEKMKTDIDDLDRRLGDLEYMLKEDDRDLDEQPNLLPIHYEVTQLRDIRDAAMDQVKTSEESLELIQNLALENGATLQDLFARLDEIVQWFDQHIEHICMNLIELVQNDETNGIVVRLALIIQEEEKHDKKVRAMQDAQREYKELAARFKSISGGARELRGYKTNFLKTIEAVAVKHLGETESKFMEQPDKLKKHTAWYFEYLNTAKLGMEQLMPKNWKIFRTYTNIYHKLMHDWLIERINDKDLPLSHMLPIVQYEERYYKTMLKLGVTDDELQPHLLDNRGPEIVREYRQHIIKFIDEWMERMSKTDAETFYSRADNATTIDASGYIRTKTLGDMWLMLREQMNVASGSEREDVVEGVVEAMFRALSVRQRTWESLIDSEFSKYTKSSSATDNTEGLESFQGWLLAIANDQIACIDDGEDESSSSYLTRFQRDFTQLVTPQFAANAEPSVDGLKNGYVDLSTHCISVLVSLIFNVDFKSILTEFFTSSWYPQQRISQVVSTFRDYLSDFEELLHPSLRDIFIEELGDELLMRYLSSVRNKGAKFRRADPFADKIRDDVITAFQFFEAYPSFPTIKETWRAADWFTRLLEADRAALPNVYEAFRREYWDAGMPWVESLLKSRDDYDRAMLNSVKSKAAEIYIDRGPETIFSKIK